MALASYLWDSLIMILYILLWFLEVLKLLTEIAGLYVALAFISICGAIVYFVNLIIVFFLFVILELTNVSVKSAVFLVIKVYDTSCSILNFPVKYILQRGSNTTEMEFLKFGDNNMDQVRQCLDDILGQVECMLAKEETGYKQSPEALTFLNPEFQKKEILFHSLLMIIKKSAKLIKEKKVLENVQFLAKVAECASDDIRLYQMKNPNPMEKEYESLTENDEIQLQAAQNLQTVFQELDSYIKSADLLVKN